MEIDKPFIHLHVLSDYSLLTSTLKLADIVELCKLEKMPTVAVTDKNNLFGALEFSQKAAAADIQPIIGATLSVARLSNEADISQPLIVDELVLLVQSEHGYKNLIKLVSQAHLDVEVNQEPHITFAQLRNHHEGLICLSGGIKGQIAKLYLEGQAQAANEAFLALNDLFQGRFYLEFTRQGYQEEVQVESFMLDLALAHQVPIVATNPCYFVNKSMHEAHTVLMCIADGMYISSEEKREVSPESYFKSTQEMGQLFWDLPEAIDNTYVIAQRCAFQVPISAPMLPRYESASGLSEGAEMERQCYEGLEVRLQTQVYPTNATTREKDQIRDQYYQRLAYELKIITQMGFDGYFLIVADFIKWAKKRKIPVGPGRGSGAGSLAAWSLTITDIDPIRFDLIFERFLNPERVSMPDFDIDFCQDRRDEVIQYVKEKYGSQQVAQIITFGKLQARAVVRDVGRVLQMPYSQVDRLCKMIPNNPADPVTLSEALDRDPLLRRQSKNEPETQALLAIAMKLEGLYRHASTHAAGIIIGDRRLDEVIPLYRDPKSDMPVTQFSFKLVEQAGLVKFDFLGLKTLSIIEHTAQLIREKHVPSFEISQISLEDKKTFELLKRVETLGIFQLESAGMRDVLKKLKPDAFEEITTLVALYRPGPMDDIPRYLACKHGEEEISFAHPMLEEVLRSSFGVMVYQEQVMQIAQKMGGYSLGSADLLRRAMGKKIKEEMDAQRATFVEGAIKNGVDQAVAHKVFDQMAKFAGYGFNKSHSAPYALLAYQTTFLKANYPVEFMASLMTYDRANTDKINLYRQEIHKMGLSLLPPDVNTSQVMFSVQEGNILYALSAIRNVGEQAMVDLVEERQKNGPFKTVSDFARRVTGKVLNKRLLENLIRAGAFDTLYANRKGLLDNVEQILAYGAQARAQKTSPQSSLFGARTLEQKELEILDAPDWSAVEKLQHEFEALGLYLSAHPVSSYKSLLKGVVSSADMATYVGQTIQMVGVILSLQKRVGKNGKKFAFLALTDEDGAYEVAIFGDKLFESQDCLVVGKVVALKVQLRATQGEDPRLFLDSIRDLSQVRASWPEQLVLRCDPQVNWDELKKRLEPICDPTGPTHFFIEIPTEDGKQMALCATGLTLSPRQEVLDHILQLRGVDRFV